ncbi:spore germination protein [Alkaliphilus peptidifermentans]|uniref:GerA spore germination protein n=1 Tax=Alkaliphilus peptidifermentans DSM 18978 TaxID=1120976 RepID=A0A1G5EW46_9FIRM|nr:spore germination protein [Alkaliphilus peptidifermentans]SCY31235.1 GerA spore germination protein [Alkaliphilus peptidifermentans DSM 18978]
MVIYIARRNRDRTSKTVYNENEVSTSLEVNLTRIDEAFKDCSDLIKRKVRLNNHREGCFIYIRGIVDIDLAQRDFINSIITLKDEELTNISVLERIAVANIDCTCDFPSVITGILSGFMICVLDGNPFVIVCKLNKFEIRNILEPEVEKNVRGPHEGFRETIDPNIAMLRRKIKNTKLKFKVLKVGTTTNQTVVISYFEDISDKAILDRLTRKIESINFDGMIAIGYVEQFISDFKLCVFPQYLATERPDKAVAALLEGRFVIIQEGTPVVIIAPVNFFSFFQALDDYSTNWMVGSLIRSIRLLGALIAIFFPALYIAITSFHYFMVPLDLLVPLAESRVKVPFPPIIEALILEVTLEMLREASIRLPSYIGISIGVVGGLIIGQAAVAAGIVSELFIIIVAVTAIASFIIPSYDMGLAVRYIRFIFMLFAAIFGIVGVVVAAALLFAHLIVLESLGQPYFQPIIPLKIRDLKDIVIRVPIKLLGRRPGQGNSNNNRRGR